MDSSSRWPGTAQHTALNLEYNWRQYCLLARVSDKQELLSSMYQLNHKYESIRDAKSLEAGLTATSSVLAIARIKAWADSAAQKLTDSGVLDNAMQVEMLKHEQVKQDIARQIP